MLPATSQTFTYECAQCGKTHSDTFAWCGETMNPNPPREWYCLGRGWWTTLYCSKACLVLSLSDCAKEEACPA